MEYRLSDAVYAEVVLLDDNAELWMKARSALPDLQKSGVRLVRYDQPELVVREIKEDGTSPKSLEVYPLGIVTQSGRDPQNFVHMIRTIESILNEQNIGAAILLREQPHHFNEGYIEKK